MTSDNPAEEELTSYKSFSVALEQLAMLLRTEVKRTWSATLTPELIESSTPVHTMLNSIEQVAKLLRSQVRSAKGKKHTWRSARRSKSVKKK